VTNDCTFHELSDCEAKVTGTSLARCPLLQHGHSNNRLSDTIGGSQSLLKSRDARAGGLLIPQYNFIWTFFSKIKNRTGEAIFPATLRGKFIR
jgi:hypothetical protein